MTRSGYGGRILDLTHGFLTGVHVVNLLKYVTA